MGQPQKPSPPKTRIVFFVAGGWGDEEEAEAFRKVGEVGFGSWSISLEEEEEEGEEVEEEDEEAGEDKVGETY